MPYVRCHVIWLHDAVSHCISLKAIQYLRRIRTHRGLFKGLCGAYAAEGIQRRLSCAYQRANKSLMEGHAKYGAPF